MVGRRWCAGEHRRREAAPHEVADEGGAGDGAASAERRAAFTLGAAVLAPRTRSVEGNDPRSLDPPVRERAKDRASDRWAC